MGINGPDPGIGRPITPPAAPLPAGRPRPGNRDVGGVSGARGQSFQAVLQREVAQQASQKLRFSAHAQARLAAAGIRMSPQATQRLEQAVERAAAKGARESLVLLDQMAFVVSVKNRTVITAVEPQRAKENVFTNIDSAVIG